MEDFIILNTGYQSAIKESLENLKDLNEYDIIKDRLDRLGDKYRIIHDDSKYIGKISKYYDKENDLGYIIFDDIYELKGVMLFVTKKEYKEIAEKELIFIKNTLKPFFNKTYEEQFKMKIEYNNILNNFTKQ